MAKLRPIAGGNAGAQEPATELAVERMLNSLVTEGRDHRERPPVGRVRSNHRANFDPGTIGTTEPLVAAAIRNVLSRYELSEGRTVPRSIAVVSALRGEGVTTISKSLAHVLASDFSATVCWVDLSWAGSGGSSSRNAESQQPGIYELLTSQLPLKEALVPSDNQRLSMLSAGRVSDGHRYALSRSPKLGDALQDLKEQFDFVIFDTAPVLTSGDALALLLYADACLLVARHGVTTASQIAATAHELHNIPTIGAILNQHRSKTPRFVRRLFDE
jgi:Mrp family chromosome partitioning ATPase